MTERAGKLIRRRIRALLMQLRFRSSLEQLRCFGLFVGYPRSGHTLVASLLDAHPNMVFANGLDAGQYLARGFSVRQVALLSVWNARRFSRHGRRSNGYDYTVPGGWHGRWRSLQVVGDKSGDLLSGHLRNDPGILARLLGRLGDRARFVHVVRNPYDCISTMAVRAGTDLRAAARVFFGLCEANAAARAAIPRGAWADLWLEDLIWQPRAAVGDLCRFFGQEGHADYLASCANLVFTLPRQSRRNSAWETELVRDVAERMRAFPWFDGYSFEFPGRVRNAANDSGSGS